MSRYCNTTHKHDTPYMVSTAAGNHVSCLEFLKIRTVILLSTISTAKHKTVLGPLLCRPQPEGFTGADTQITFKSFQITSKIVNAKRSLHVKMQTLPFIKKHLIFSYIWSTEANKQPMFRSLQKMQQACSNSSMLLRAYIIYWGLSFVVFWCVVGTPDTTRPSIWAVWRGFT